MVFVSDKHNMLPEPEDFEKYFHELYRHFPDSQRKRQEWKKKKKMKGKDKVRSKLEVMPESDLLTPPEMELPANASSFAMFASIRLAVLDRWMRQANHRYLQSSCSAPMPEQSDIDSDTEDNSESSTYVPMKVSKIVGLGLRSVFELIKESRSSHPKLCGKALTALLDVLQGQSPEGLKNEPSEVIDSLFDLLLDLATLHGPESTYPNDGSHLTAIACACLLSLVVVRGDTGKYLAATAALLMCPRALAMQNIQMPVVLTSLQRSIHGVLLGKLIRPDWITHGIPKNCHIDTFQIRMPTDLQNIVLTLKSMTCDGQYLYLFTSKGLIKIGTGYGNTLKGHVYVWKQDFYPNDRGCLLYCASQLFLKLAGRKGIEFMTVEKQNLVISGSIALHSRDASAPVVFSDGDHLGTISPAKDDGFVVRMLNHNTTPASVISELPLKLARKCVDILGLAPYEEEAQMQTASPCNDEEVATITAGKDFSLIKTVNGKVLYSGKAAALGIKQAGVRTSKWSEFVMAKAPKVSHIAVGHDGLHAVLVTEDGSVFFAGTARRGEDGDQSKVRRQPKPMKPKKMIKVDGQIIVGAACNNGTTALITKEGELLMFGKDTTHTDNTSGVVTSLKGEYIIQVALGKAHALALTNAGQVYSFGINNKYQCGREFVVPNREDCAPTVIAMDTCISQEDQDTYDDIEEIPRTIEDVENQAGGSDANNAEQPMCPAGMHSWHHNMCMVCSICRECTGYSISCLSALRPDRNPGQECGCGEGDSGCAICGCCRICAQENVDNSELTILEPSGALNLAGMMRLDLIFRDKVKELVQPKQRAKLQEQLQSRLDEKKVRGRKSLPGPSKQSLKMKTARSAVNILATPTHRASNALRQAIHLAKEQPGSDVERDTTRIACLAPGKIRIPADSPVVQISCGLHHNVLLLQNGQVYSFGSNQYGQLGCGDILAKASIQLVKLPCSAVHVAAGSNHTVVLTSKGEVYTFGHFQKGQLGRQPPVTSPQDASQPSQSTIPKYSNPRTPWYSTPGSIPNVGPRYGRRATWVGASGDQSFIKIDESLINSVSLAKSTVTANKNCIVLVPNQLENSTTFKCLVINKRDGNCNSYKGHEQIDFYGKSVCLDPVYNVLWSYNPVNHEAVFYNIISTELRFKSVVETSDYKFLCNITTGCSMKNEESLSTILLPELALPCVPTCHVTRLQAAIHLLCCLDTLTVAHDLKLSCAKEEVDENKLNSGKLYTREDFQGVNRFESHGGGWGYSGHSIEAIRFMADTDILLGGFGLFGGRGEYTGKIKLIDIGPEGGEQETDGTLLAETDEIPYECGPRQKYPMLFEEPIQLQAQRWYVAWCRISGPSSDCGSSGQAMVTTEDQVLFYFKSSKKSNNGTDVNAGQIPQLLYKVITPENQSNTRQVDIVEPVHILTRDFSKCVTKECFQSLLSLLQWSWNTFKLGIADCQSLQHMYTALELGRLVYISRATLRLIRTYTNEIYPNQINRKIPLENVHLAECVGDVRALLKQILSDSLPAVMHSKKSSKGKPKINEIYKKMVNGILEECHTTFVACFHAFYPTAFLKWTCLCDLLTDIENESKNHSTSNSQRLLSAVLCSLCSSTVRLRSTFPLLGGNISSDSSLHRGLSPSDNTGLPMMSCSDLHHYPILVEQMSYRSQMESLSAGFTMSWKEVLDSLLSLISEPVNKALLGHKCHSLPELTRYCCHLLARVVAELVHQCSATEDDLQNGCGRILHMTPSRFTRTNQSRTWNTGNGSPDAICFQVDRPGISIAGVSVFAGIGHYEYEVELLEDQSSVTAEAHGHTQRWNSLEVARGSYGPEDFAPDMTEIKFDRAVPIKENIKYAIRLRNHGGRTNNGDGGLASVKGSDNTTFTFSTSTLSFNGTTLTRGQIPIMLYYSNPSEVSKSSCTRLDYQARKGSLTMLSEIVQRCCNLLSIARERAEDVPVADILGNCDIVKTLLPLVMAHVSPLATSDPRSAVQILNLIQDMLPHVAALNLICGSTSSFHFGEEYVPSTTSHHYNWVQSDHPYKPATVSNYRITFPDAVKWMSIEFDQSCSTAQPEDCLQLYVPNSNKTQGKLFSLVESEDEVPMPYWPVLHKFTSSLHWPQNSIILPGHEVLFSLETASDYLKDDKASSYGFKCLVVGYEWPPIRSGGAAAAGLKHLEAELAFLGGMCAASLIKKDLQLPVDGVLGDDDDNDLEVAEVVAAQTLATHNSLLSKGLALNSAPNVMQALDGMLPYGIHSNERLFLKDFVGCIPGSSGGRLAQWLQPASRVDPSKCHVIYAREELRCGWPAIITVLTCDQYKDVVHVPNMKVEIKAVPIDKKDLGDDVGRKMRRVSQPDPLTFGGLPPPPLHHPYEPTVRDKMCFHSITVMKPYQNYSFEELRYTSPRVKRSSENMLVRPNGDGTYSGTWTPASIGCYSILINIDGYEMEEQFKVEVKEPPQGMTPPSQNLAKKSTHQPSKLRKFVAKNSAGLRIRAHPSLQSEQIGIVHVNGTIAFIDEIHNDDGVWLRLSADTIKQYCNIPIIEAWCLQYNQHLGKTLLLPVEEPKSLLDQVISETIMRKLPEIHDRRKASTGFCGGYQVIKCGASGHNVRSNPSLKASPVGMLVLGNKIGISQYVINSDGCWVLLDQATRDKYCFSADGEAWSLAMGHNNTLYLGTVLPEQDTKSSDPVKPQKGFDFQSSHHADTTFSFGAAPAPSSSPPLRLNEAPSSNPFVFGDTGASTSSKAPKRDKKDGKLSSLPKWFKNEDGKCELPSELSGVSVKDLVKAIGESRANGNGVTPPDTPKRSCSPRAPGCLSPKPGSRSSSPVPIPPRSTIIHDSPSSSSHAIGSPRSIGISPLAAGPESIARSYSNPSDTSVLVSSIPIDLSQSPSQSKDLSASPSLGSLHTESEMQQSKKEEVDSEESPRKLMQTGTQTSPESNVSQPPMKGTFSIGAANKEERISPKLIRKDRTGKPRTKRAISPASFQQLPASSKVHFPNNAPVKEAMSPSVAESLRAVFAAFLWHEGVVHDAMACASFLKFHPTLPKEGAVVVTRQPHSEHLVDKRRQELTKEEKARQRHSVEVSNAGNYLHIQASTLESLTRSAANASANRSRNRKLAENIIKEDVCTEKFSAESFGPHTVTVLPPALKCLVYLWEELTTNCLQSITQQTILSAKAKKYEKMGSKDKDKNIALDKETKRSRKKKLISRNYLDDIGLSNFGNQSNDRETVCELCGENFPHPVTYHMKVAHPGCDHHAGSKGYNSGGNYCLGWAGNCGEGGVPGSSWYLLCEECREKYMKANKGSKVVPMRAKPVATRRKTVKSLMSPTASASNEAHVIMKNNAMFLLDLASAADTGMAHQRRPSSSIMPSVSENITPPDTSGPFSPLPPFQCLQALGATCDTSEGAFYEEVLRRQNVIDGSLPGPSSGQRPLSEVSLSEDGDIGKGMRVHRSVSMGTNGIPWSKAGLDGRIIMLRKRNNSSSEMMNEGGSSLLCNPSSALQKLVPKMENSAIVANSHSNHSLNSEPQIESLSLLQRPVMQFLIRQHDLESLQMAMKQALRKAVCRVYAMQGLNWLLKSVTQPVCLHDLLWWFVTSLTPLDIEVEGDDDNKPSRKIEELDLNVCEHPLSDITIAGEAVHPLPNTFHNLLQTIADLMVLLPMGSALQQMAVRCWGLRFAQSDHAFLHRSQVFSNISKILSRSEELEDTTISMHESHHSFSQFCSSVESLKDLTPSLEIKSSSRQAMVGSLTDGSTETFWESGDEDRNKTKNIYITCMQGHHPKLICVHIDNCRDLGNKVSNIVFYSGPNADELTKSRSVDIETRLLGGWINCPLQDSANTSVIRLEVKGPDNTVRIRQIRVLGEVDGETLKVGKQHSAITIQQRNCEAETLRVFRLITAQVFGKLIVGEGENQNVNNHHQDSGSQSTDEGAEPLEESNDLKEHMVGILFSRSKLTHLQKQVIVHIVQAIRKETMRVREEWENLLCSATTNSSSSGHSQDPVKPSDTYCFEMLSMVLALSGSSVGRAYLSHQGGLIGDLLSLLHTGSARVQRQVTSLLRRILPEIPPENFAKVMSVEFLPPKDFGIVSSKGDNFDTHRPGIIDVFLSVISKSLMVQVKIKGKNGSGNALKEINTVTLATSIHPRDYVGSRWWLRGSMNRKLAEVIVHLIKDMATGKLSEAWSNITKAAIAQNILNLTHLSDEQRLPSTCLRTPTLWLALASLCVLDKDHVERLSSGQWSKTDGAPSPPRPTCSNHDDGETNAVIQCSSCGNLCADCDRFLHLHRKTRNHQRQVCKEEEEAIKVELHEGCGRTKLFWLLALADARTLKALVEYREGGTKSRGAGASGVCRFCGAVGSSGLLAIGNVCADHECQEYAKSACSKLLNCGHMCGGVQNETCCLPCLHGCSSVPTLRQDADDMCMICFTEALSCAPAIQLKCGHVFHLHCCKTVLTKKWAGPRITFSFSQCPICKAGMEHEVLKEVLEPINELYKDVRRKALMRLEYEGLHTADAIVAPGARFYNDPATYAMDRYAYYVCFKCNKAYYGGEARCDAEVGERYDPAELVCGGCSDITRAQMCPKHGTDFLEYKCRYCCSVAVFFCFGTTHFCNPCHDDFQRVTNLPRIELPMCPAGPKAKQLEGDECPLHVKHPPTGEEFALGCGVCRNAHTF